MNKAWRRYITIFFKILLGCMLGLFALVYYFAHDEIFKQNLENRLIQHFSSAGKNIFEGKIEKIDLFARNVIFQNLSLTSPEDSDWSMHADSMRVQLLLKESLYHKKLCYALHFEHLALHEKFKNNPSKIVHQLETLFSGPADDFTQLSYIMMHNSKLFFMQEDQQQIYIADFEGTGSAEKGVFKLALYITDGKTVINQQEVIQDIHAYITTEIPASNSIQEIYAKVDVKCKAPSLYEEQRVYMNAELFHGSGRCILKTANEGIVIDALNFNFTPTQCLFDMHVVSTFEDLKKQKILPAIFQEVGGSCTLFLQGDFYDIPASLQGNIMVHNIFYKENKFLDNADFYIKRLESNAYESVLRIGSSEVIQVHVEYTPEKIWKLALQNLQTIPLLGSYWQIPEKQLDIQAQIDSDFQVAGNYEIGLFSPQLEEKVLCKGTYSGKDSFYMTGSIGLKSYEMKLQVFPKILLELLQVQEGDQRLIDIKQLDKKHVEIQGAIDFALFKLLVPENLQFMFAQEGKMLVDGKQKENEFITTLRMKDAHIRIPYVYNILENASAQIRFDLASKAVYLEKVLVHLYEGDIVSKCSTLLFEESLLPSFAHAPFYLDNVLVSWDKGIFGVFSGRVQWETKEGKHTLLGDVVVQKAQLEGNIFSPDFQAQLFGMSGMSGKSAFGYDVSLVTKDLIQVKTSFLDAQAKIHVRAKNENDHLVVQGSIDLVDGEFKFPYKSLAITQGKISFMPGKKFDPALQVIAKGRIKRHDITMHVSGTVSDPHVEFAAVPYITREQIVSLLLFGSDDNSIAILPDFVHKQLNDIIFGPAVSESKLQRRFTTLLEPLKYVRFYPQLDNQQGRGGMRGIIEINATDRLRGKINSNFFQLEDTKFEVDYDINDSVTARAMRDGPATYGGELEMRWKW